MAERDLLVGAITAEILGPRDGSFESLPPDENPLDEYITGVLAPRGVSSLAPDNLELDGGGDAGADDDQDPGDPVDAPASVVAMPALDPRARPASIGLSFVLEGHAPIVDVCATWGRYASTSVAGWRRQPHGGEWRGVSCLTPPPMSVASDPSVELTIRCRADRGRWRVSIFLVNATPVTSGFPDANVHVFQPQIRIVCTSGVRLVPLEEGAGSREEEERGLAMLYANRPVLARGHLCAAMWADVDPERPFESVPSPSVAPFKWTDGDSVIGTDAPRYTPCDARTEFVPVLAVLAPEKGWTSSLGSPELDPATLAEAWDGETLRTMLEPLPAAYEHWIADRETEAAGMPADREVLARANLAGCRSALTRIQAAIELLAANDEERLAFCFANKAIALQSQWTRGRVNRWYPFQLAFQLLNLRAVAMPAHSDRDICDLLWYPTGGGKTEAYLGLAAFTMALRRLRAERGEPTGRAGVAVLSRYTLRLLTIQQFRRALAVVTACEFLRIRPSNRGIGWRPGQCDWSRPWIWGTERFSAGLWVGGTVTPNLLQDFQYRARNGTIRIVHGAISILEDIGRGEGEPAQVLTCPACSAILAVPSDGYQPGDHIILNLIVGDAATSAGLPTPSVLSRVPFDVTSVEEVAHADRRFKTFTVAFIARDEVRPHDIDAWWTGHLKSRLGPDAYLVAARASRPGYFVRTANFGSRRQVERAYDFEIFCPNPTCALNTDTSWSEITPAGSWPVLDAFRQQSDAQTSSRCPIPAWTVDEQVYHRLPTMLIATVDKFARLAFEPKAGAIFGNVDRYHERLGYHRLDCPPSAPGQGIPRRPEPVSPIGNTVPTARLLPPDLILQDELHLIEGPLGSMVGLYETAVDVLASATTRTQRVRPKYVASTATVRRAREQGQSLFLRSLDIFPGPGLRADDSFFALTDIAHPLDADPPGRLYVGVCAPGRGAQTPIVRLWSRVLQHVHDRQAAGASVSEIDRFWTLVGYFNAMRELAGAVALARQDVLQRLTTISMNPRQIDENEPMELSSRADSLALPGMLEQLKISLGGAAPASSLAVATSMFGTGVDVDRLGMMMVAGQPKTTSAYIQATGRVGRSAGGLVITFYRAARPRDLNHYEFFAAYHNALYRHVEPVTVNPFAPRARDRALGPLAVSLLRQGAELPTDAGAVRVDDRWRAQQRITGGWYCQAEGMAAHRLDHEVIAIPQLVEHRAQSQPPLRRPTPGEALNHAASELDRWQQLAARQGARVVYSESTQVNPPSRPVVLGDRAHLLARFDVAYEDAPNSLRDVEPTITVRGWLPS